MTDKEGHHGVDRITAELAGKLDSYAKEMDKFSDAGIPMAAPGAPYTFETYYGHPSVPPAIEKKAYATSLGLGKIQTHVELTEKDMDDIRAKRKLTDEAEFDAWILEKFPPWGNPSNQRFIEQTYPELLQKIDAWNKWRHEKKSEYESALINGPKDLKDLYNMYRISTDDQVRWRMFAPTGPLQPQVGFARDKIREQTVYTMGFARQARLARDAASLAQGAAMVTAKTQTKPARAPAESAAFYLPAPTFGPDTKMPQWTEQQQTLKFGREGLPK